MANGFCEIVTYMVRNKKSFLKRGQKEKCQSFGPPKTLKKKKKKLFSFFPKHR